MHKNIAKPRSQVENRASEKATWRVVPHTIARGSSGAAPFLLKAAARARRSLWRHETKMTRSTMLLVLVVVLVPMVIGAQEKSDKTVHQANSHAPAAEADRDSAPSYVLGPEDVLEVFVWKNPELSTTATVRPDGRITLPLAGELQASGRSPEELRDVITTHLRRYIENPFVTVMVKAIISPQISVLGEVRRPGRYRIAQQATIFDAIALGGGLSEFASGKDVLVLRTTPSGVNRIRVNVKQLLREGKPLVLEPGDTIYVH
jgi:polysaccharide biosynthesis/export protein